MKKLTRDEMAKRLAQDIPEGAYVNLGIGIPTKVSAYLPKNKEIFLQSENGLLGMGPPAKEGEIDTDLINAGKQPVTLLEGGCYFDHGTSFAMMRGGHIDICVLGAFEVSVHGDLANWASNSEGAIPAVGGAMDLAVGAKKTFVIMELFTKQGMSKLVDCCNLPLTGLNCVSRVYTDLAVFSVGSKGAEVLEMIPGLNLETLREMTGLSDLKVASEGAG